MSEVKEIVVPHGMSVCRQCLTARPARQAACSNKCQFGPPPPKDALPTHPPPPPAAPEILAAAVRWENLGDALVECVAAWEALAEAFGIVGIDLEAALKRVERLAAGSAAAEVEAAAEKTEPATGELTAESARGAAAPPPPPPPPGAGGGPADVSLERPRSRRSTIDEHLLAVAWATAKRSTCLRAPDGVGTVLSRQGRVLSTGYAGSVRGDAHCVDVGCMLDVRGKCVRTVHAELNALLQAAAHGVSVEGAAAYCTMSPCWDCFKALKSAGVVRVVFDVSYTDTALQERHAAAWGVSWERRGTAVFVPGGGVVG